MLPEITPGVTRALEAARIWACRLGAEDLQPIHLLHGLLEDPESQAAILLARAGVSLTAVRPAAAAEPVEEREVPLSAAVEQVFFRARVVAGETSPDRTVTGGQVLFSLLAEVEPLRQWLETLGLAFTTIESAIQGTQGPPLKLDEPLELAPPTERIDAGRILDAAANRAREGLRVLEDYCRFALDDAFLSRECKQLRHDLAEALDTLPDALLLAARETRRDVGTRLTAVRELNRHSLREVVRVNCKRLQESLRSLEEIAKLHHQGLAQLLEQLRYRSYTLERTLLLGASARQRLADARLYLLVTGSTCAAAIDWTIREAAAGGVQMVQLREKAHSDRALLERARNVRRWTRHAGVLFIVNDRPDIARLAEADGVHLGQEDLPVKEARRILGPDALVGVSTHDLDQVRQAVLDGASYLGVGPTFPSDTKPFDGFPGLDFVRQATAETSLPAFVIGGIGPETVGAAVAAGARRVAVSGAVCRAADPRQVAALLRTSLEEGDHLQALQ